MKKNIEYYENITCEDLGFGHLQWYLRCRKNEWGVNNYYDDVNYYSELKTYGRDPDDEIHETVGEMLWYESEIIYYKDAGRVLAENPGLAEEVMSDGLMDLKDYSICRHASWVRYYEMREDMSDPYNIQALIYAAALEYCDDYMDELAEPRVSYDIEMIILADFLNERNIDEYSTWSNLKDAAEAAAREIIDSRN